MEEGTEFIERFTHPGSAPMPMFTSCCPGWMRFVKTQAPELLGNISTCKSPQQMFGAITKTYFAEKMGIDPANLLCVDHAVRGEEGRMHMAGHGQHGHRAGRGLCADHA